MYERANQALEHPFLQFCFGKAQNRKLFSFLSLSRLSENSCKQREEFYLEGLCWRPKGHHLRSFRTQMMNASFSEQLSFLSCHWLIRHDSFSRVIIAEWSDTNHEQSEGSSASVLRIINTLQAPLLASRRY